MIKFITLNKIPIREVISMITPFISTLSILIILWIASLTSTPTKIQIIRTVVKAAITSNLACPKVFRSLDFLFRYLFEIQIAKNDNRKPATSEN